MDEATLREIDRLFEELARIIERALLRAESPEERRDLLRRLVAVQLPLVPHG